MQTFVVERYWPGVSRDEAALLVAREAEVADAMQCEGRHVRVVRTTLVESDEMLLSVVEARTEDDVAMLGERAGRAVDRIVRARDVVPAGALTETHERRRRR
jgi:hypothetical protein